MSESTSKKLTSIEIKVLHHRYGIKSLDERKSLRVLRICNGGKVIPLKSKQEVARTLQQDTSIIDASESSALQKLRANF